MISRIRQEVKKEGSAIITPYDYDELQAEWIQRAKLAQDNAVNIKIKREIFRFASKQEWINKAQSWFSVCEVNKSNYIAVDATGIICRVGKQFMDAEKNESYPVVVYELEG
jgi:hypothetical protein